MSVKRGKEVSNKFNSIMPTQVAGWCLLRFLLPPQSSTPSERVRRLPRPGQEHALALRLSRLPAWTPQASHATVSPFNTSPTNSAVTHSPHPPIHIFNPRAERPVHLHTSINTHQRDLLQDVLLEDRNIAHEERDGSTRGDAPERQRGHNGEDAAVLAIIIIRRRGGGGK